MIPGKIYRKLYVHQRRGVQWLWQQRQRRGALLADDMGLGKTIQVCALLEGLFHALKISRRAGNSEAEPAAGVLLVVPGGKMQVCQLISPMEAVLVCNIFKPTTPLCYTNNPAISDAPPFSLFFFFWIFLFLLFCLC